MFAPKRRLVTFAAWLTLCPNWTCLPQISQVPVPANSFDPLYHSCFLLYHYAGIVPVADRRESNSAHWPKAAPKLDDTINVNAMQAERSFPETPNRPDQAVSDAPAADQSVVPGRVEITPTAIATLASQAIGESYGVVGLASRHSRPALAELLRKDESHKGVEVSFANDRVVIDLYVIL